MVNSLMRTFNFGKALRNYIKDAVTKFGHQDVFVHKTHCPDNISEIISEKSDGKAHWFLFFFFQSA